MGSGRGTARRTQARRTSGRITVVEQQLQRMPLGKQCPVCKAVVSRLTGTMICGCENKLKIKKQPGGVYVYRWRSPKGEPSDYYPELRAGPLTSSQRIAVVGDTHGNFLVLKKVLLAAGVINEAGVRQPGWDRVIHIGDLMDGRRADSDLVTLRFAEDVFDEVLVGNHEAAYLGGERFDGMEQIDPESKMILNRWEREGKLVVATTVDDWLLTHAGLDPELGGRPEDGDHDVASQAEVEATAAELNEVWRRHRDSGAFEKYFLRIGNIRGGTAPYGGVLWNDLDRLVATEEHQYYKQIVGHSPRKAALTSPAGMIVDVDVGASHKKATSCVVVDPDGNTVFAGGCE